MTGSEYLLVQTADELRDCVDHYLAQDAWAFDVETTGTHRGDPIRNHVVWIALSSGDRTDVIPMGHPHGDLLEVKYPLLKSGLERQAEGKPLRKTDYSIDIRKAEFIWSPAPEQLDRSAVFRALEPLFAGPAVKIGHNVKFDINSVSKYLPAPPVGPYFDTMVAEWCLNSGNFGRLSLDACAERTLGITVEKGVGKQIEAHAFDVVADYASIDARVTYLLGERLSDLLDEEGVAQVFDLEMQVLEVLADMERTGVCVDQDLLATLDNEFAERTEEARLMAWAAAGETFNLASVPTKQRLLFTPKKDGGQGLRGTVLTPAGEKKVRAGGTPELSDYSTSAKALQTFASKSELAQALLDHAKFGKLRTTYTRPYLGGDRTRQRGNKEATEWVESRVVDGRIHTRYIQSRVETGRLSSKEPNLMNVPSRSEEGKKIRDLFIATHGYTLVQADYSQIEPRIIADLSGDPTMLETYRSGGDIYLTVADKLGVDRNTGKTLVLAIAYGIGPAAIAESNNMTKTQAQELMSFFRAQFPRIDRHKRVVLSSANKHNPPYTETVLGRRRYLPGLKSRDEGIVAYSQRQAYNHVIQGSAADVMKLALVRIRKMLPDYGRMLLTVHDEIVTEVPHQHVDETVEIVRQAMESVGDRWFSVPLVADVKVADRWGACKD